MRRWFLKVYLHVFRVHIYAPVSMYDKICFVSASFFSVFHYLNRGKFMRHAHNWWRYMLMQIGSQRRFDFLLLVWLYCVCCWNLMPHCTLHSSRAQPLRFDLIRIFILICSKSESWENDIVIFQTQTHAHTNGWKQSFRMEPTVVRHTSELFIRLCAIYDGDSFCIFHTLACVHCRIVYNLICLHNVICIRAFQVSK